MKRPDVRLAWREKVTIVWIIFFLCAIVLFYIIAFGKLLCPGQNTVWNTGQLGGHNNLQNYWAAIAGEVYDLTDFVQGDHSNVIQAPVTQSGLETLAGFELTHYFPVPLITGCPGLVNDANLALTPANFSSDVPNAVHASGAQTVLTGALTSASWYPNSFLPAIEQYKKGAFVWSHGDIKKQAQEAGRLVLQRTSMDSIRLTKFLHHIGYGRYGISKYSTCQITLTQSPCPTTTPSTSFSQNPYRVSSRIDQDRTLRRMPTKPSRRCPPINKALYSNA